MIRVVAPVPPDDSCLSVGAALGELEEVAVPRERRWRSERVHRV